MILSKGRKSFISPVDIKSTVDGTAMAILKPAEVEIEVVSFSSRKSSKNIQLVFKDKEGKYLSFEDIIKLDIKPENFEITMGGTTNNPKAEDGKTGSYRPEGGNEVEHSFKDDPLFVCRNNEYGGSFSTNYPGAGFMKVHCETDFENNAEFVVAIENVDKANFAPATKKAGTFSS